MALTEIKELGPSDIGAQVSDDAMGDAESVFDVVEELSCFGSGSLDQWLDVYPLRKLVNCYEDMVKAAWHCFEWPHHVQPPACERP